MYELVNDGKVSWRVIQCKGEVPSARSGHSFTFVPGSNLFFLFGGCDDDEKSLGDFRLFDPSTHLWKEGCYFSSRILTLSGFCWLPFSSTVPWSSGCGIKLVHIWRVSKQGGRRRCLQIRHKSLFAIISFLFIRDGKVDNSSVCRPTMLPHPQRRRRQHLHVWWARGREGPLQRCLHV
jgi:hypothetical protein